jgi:hypothetical protein
MESESKSERKRERERESEREYAYLTMGTLRNVGICATCCSRKSPLRLQARWDVVLPFFLPPRRPRCYKYE